MKSPMLENVSLCAIVRDEMMNPAGGITDFVESTVPYVGEAVIVDTGSIDGTKEELDKLASKYSSLKVVSHKWKGYADARNKSMELATKDYIMMLDADERLTQYDFQTLDGVMKGNPASAYIFKFLAIKPIKRNAESKSFGFNPRLFLRNLEMQFVDHEGIYEAIKNPHPIKVVAEVPLSIKHFIPKAAATSKKVMHWYKGILSGSQMGAPSQTSGFSEWKAYNPLREKYR
jgi:glycosyltransferase involved in cell wall biosynthesis